MTRHESQIEALRRLAELANAIESLPPDVAVNPQLDTVAVFISEEDMRRVFSGQKCKIESDGTINTTCYGVRFRSLGSRFNRDFVEATL